LAGRAGFAHALAAGSEGKNSGADMDLSRLLPESPDSFLKKFYYDTALSASPHAFASLQTLADSSRIVFGTDYIFATQGAVALTIKGIDEYPGFKEKDRVAIENGNALALFPGLKDKVRI
jgi:predicted TIM-barrel fold metal-dependent hydrolase